MIEKISQSKNPAEATAAMVAALATTTKFGNQRKLLLELTKKVDEQKRLLEQKRISAKVGQSPVSSSPGEPSVSGTPTVPRALSKDPRIRKQELAAAKEVDSFLEGTGEDIDLRDRSGFPPLVSASSVPTQTVTSSVSQAVTVSSAPSVLTSSLLKESVSSLLSLTSEISSSTKKVEKSQKVPGTVTEASDSKKNNQSSLSKPTGFYRDPTESESDAVKTAKVTVPDVQEQNSEKSDDVHSDQDNAKTGSSGSDSKSANQGAEYDIVSQLQAEISGKPVVTDSSSKSNGEMDKLSSTKKTDTAAEGSKSNADSPQVPNVTSLFKNLASGSSDAGKKSGIQLPTALMSLFSKLPGSAEEPSSKPTETIPGLFSSETTEDGSESKLDNQDNKEGTELPGLGTLKDTSEVSKTSASEKSESKDEKLSKSFLGFDYDSDSSGGSFEGFDDDGTRKLSPKKRKLVQKKETDDTNKPKTNLFGDIDERTEVNQEQMDEDLRKPQDEDLDFQKEDIDERVGVVPPPGLSGNQAMPFPLPQHGIPLPFIPSDQPPPPGEEWNVAPQPIIPPISMAMPQLPPPAEWTPLPGLDAQAEVPTQPPLPPLPAEPPAPKPPEPPVKKKKLEEDYGSDDEPGMSKSKKKKKKKDKKKKGETSSSDERLKQIVLEIAKKEPINPPPVPPANTRLIPGGYSMPAQPMMPMGQAMQPMMTSVDNMPPLTNVMDPVSSQEPVWDHSSSMGVHGWQTGMMGPGLDTQAQMTPQPLPPHLQQGVASGEPSDFTFQGQGFGPRGLPRPGLKPQMHGRVLKGNTSKPLPLLEAPLFQAPKKLKGEEHRLSESPSARDVSHPGFEGIAEASQAGDIDKPEDSKNQEQEKRDREERAREKDEKRHSRDRDYDRDDRRRRDHYRSRSRDRDRDRNRDHRRSRSRERSRGYHHRRSSYDKDRHYRGSRH